MAIRRELDRLLKDSEAGVLDVMQSNLSYMADSLINRIETKDKGLTSSNKLEAVKGLTASGTNFYKKERMKPFYYNRSRFSSFIHTEHLNDKFFIIFPLFGNFI